MTVTMSAPHDTSAPATEPAAPQPDTSTDDGVDITLIRWMLSLTPSERLDVLQGFVDSTFELSGAPRRT